MKGIVSTLIILLIFTVSLLLAISFSSKTLELDDIVIRNLVLDKVYNTFISIEHAVQELMLFVSPNGGINVTISDQNNFTIVTFNETLPRYVNSSKFNEDLENFERFAETKLNETNIAVDLILDAKCLSFVIQPYNITYTHNPGIDCLSVSAHTEVVVDPQSSWQYVNGYSFIFRPNGNLSGASITGWSGPGCNKPGLGLNITIAGKDITLGPSATTSNYNRMCRYNIDDISCPAGLGYIHLIHNQNSDVTDNGVVDIEIHPNCNITSAVSLNLTKTTGKVSVESLFQKIKIKETLYRIEKNDTIRNIGG